MNHTGREGTGAAATDLRWPICRSFRDTGTRAACGAYCSARQWDLLAHTGRGTAPSAFYSYLPGPVGFAPFVSRQAQELTTEPRRVILLLSQALSFLPRFVDTTRRTR